MNNLTKIELECLRLRYELGYSNAEVARIIEKSVRTAENYFRAAAEKLNASGGRGRLLVAYNKMKAL